MILVFRHLVYSIVGDGCLGIGYLRICFLTGRKYRIGTSVAVFSTAVHSAGGPPCALSGARSKSIDDCPSTSADLEYVIL